MMKILIIDDEATLRLSLQMWLQDLGYEVKAVDNMKEGWKEIEHFSPNILLLDIRLPDGNGIDMLKKIKSDYLDIGVIVLTGYGNTRSAVEAMKSGAFDYLTKPFELEEIDIAIKKYIEQHKLELEVERFREKEKRAEAEMIVGKSPAVETLKEELSLVAKSPNTTVLIQGETGTGKELAAKSIHNMSSRQSNSFVPVNCGAIPSHLVESELFGHEKGAFTGANQRKKGLIELADGGTLFLDEIGELSLEIQVKLLRFLEDKKIKRVGGVKDIEVDVRVIAATNRPLEKMIQEGTFRSDLYYRLNVVPINIPPLRDRGEDIIILAEYFLKQFSLQMGKQEPFLSSQAKEQLMKYSWPGNIRELKNIMERVVILNHDETIEEHHLHFLNKREEQHEKLMEQDPLLDRDFSLEKYLEKIEIRFIVEALKLEKWNITRAAEKLGISRYALQRRIEKYNIH
jgi:two-component system, NtrC family, response regulator AtoC